MPQDRTDNELVKEMLSGRKESFAALVERYQQAAYKMALVILRHPADAEDAVSEAFVKAFQALPGCRDGTNLKSWLLKITYNCCYDTLRKRTVTGKYQSPEAAETVSGGPNPLEEVIDHEDKQALWSALAKLPPEERSAVVMKYYHGLSYQDIAAALNWPMGTVASKLARAREKLHQMLKGGDNQ